MSGTTRERISSVVFASLVVLLLSGCITTRTGPLPEPADLNARMQAQLDLARGYVREDSLVRARETLSRALEYDRNSVEAYVLLAFVEEREGEHAQAEASYRKALRLDSSNAQALTNFGGFLVRRGRYQDALPPLRRAVTDSNYYARAQAYESLGLAEKAAGNATESKLAFEKSLGLNRDQAIAALELADIEHDAGRHEIARELYGQFRRQALANTGITQTARSICLGVKISAALNDADALASYRLSLRNLFPQQAAACEVPQA